MVPSKGGGTLLRGGFTKETIGRHHASVGGDLEDRREAGRRL